MKKVTIYEVAKEAKVSLATVSRVMNGPNLVKRETREAVEAAIKKLGYRPNAIAQGLALNKTTTIGLIISDASDYYTGQIINGISDVAKVYNYNLYIYNATDGINNIDEILDNVIKHHVDGVLYCINNSFDTNLDILEKYNIPIVFVGSKMESKDAYCVYIDFEEMVYDTCNKYLDKGKKNIAILHDRKNKFISKSMLQGATRSFDEHGLKFKNYINTAESTQSSYKFLLDYLKKKDYDLVIVNRDSQAGAFINAAKENGIKVPGTTEVVCLCESKYTDMMRPIVSSYSLPSYDVGAVSMRLITKLLKDENIKERHKCLPAIFQKKQTTK